MITVADLPEGPLLKRHVPKPPAEAKRWNGDPPYRNGGYVIDLDIDDGHAIRWRYDNQGLVAFIVYWSNLLDVKPSRPWRSGWTRK